MAAAKPKAKTMRQVCEGYIGEKVAVLAARYQYRGLMSQVSDDVITLANAAAVEVSGPSSGDVPNTEDPINGDVHISLNAVEIVYRPNWVNAPLSGEA